MVTLMPPPKLGDVLFDQVQESKETTDPAIHCAPPPVPPGEFAALSWKVQDLKITFAFTRVIPPPRKASFVTPSAKVMNSNVIGRACVRLEGAMRRISVVRPPVKTTAAPAAARTVNDFGVGKS